MMKILSSSLLLLALSHVTLLAEDYNFFSYRSYVPMKGPLLAFVGYLAERKCSTLS